MITATEIFAAIANCSENFSIGYRRLVFLPAKIRTDMGRAAILLHDASASDVHSFSKEFLAKLSDAEYFSWLKANGIPE